MFPNDRIQECINAYNAAKPEEMYSFESNGIEYKMSCKNYREDLKAYKLHLGFMNAYVPIDIIWVYPWPDRQGYGGHDLMVIEDLTGSLAKVQEKREKFACLPDMMYDDTNSKHSQIVGGWGKYERGKINLVTSDLGYFCPKINPKL